jgi:hypothetical protein
MDVATTYLPRSPRLPEARSFNGIPAWHREVADRLGPLLRAADQVPEETAASVQTIKSVTVL